MKQAVKMPNWLGEHSSYKNRTHVQSIKAEKPAQHIAYSLLNS